MPKGLLQHTQGAVRASTISIIRAMVLNVLNIMVVSTGIIAIVGGTRCLFALDLGGYPWRKNGAAGTDETPKLAFSRRHQW